MLKKSTDTIFIDTANIRDEDIEDISSIEQDVWARDSMLWEYIKCWDCWEVSSKEAVFHWLPKEIRLMTVNKVEKLLWISRISCQCCGSKNTHHIYWDQNKQIIYQTLKSPSSFLVIWKTGWELTGFVSWYVEKIETIFTRELSYHFSDKIIDILMKEVWFTRDEEIMTFSWMWADEINSNLFIIFELMKKLFTTLPLSMDDLLCVIEWIEGTFSHKLYKLMWASSIDKNLVTPYRVWSEKVSSEVLHQKNIISTYRNNLASPVSLIKKNLRSFI